MSVLDFTGHSELYTVYCCTAADLRRAFGVDYTSSSGQKACENVAVIMIHIYIPDRDQNNS